MMGDLGGRFSGTWWLMAGGVGNQDELQPPSWHTAGGLMGTEGWRNEAKPLWPCWVQEAVG